MSQVEFNDEQRRASLLYSKIQSSSEVPTLVRWVMSTGIAKTPEAANGVLLTLAVISLLIGGYLMYMTYSGGVQRMSVEERRAFDRATPGYQGKN